MTSNHTLTRIYLNPARRGGRKLILNPQAMHAAVRAAFPPDTDESRGRILWRLDHHEHAHTLYIVGPERPDVANIVEQAGWHTRPGQSADYGKFLDRLQRGQRWHFEVIVNPVISKSQGPGKRGKRVPLASADSQLQWLIRRSEENGFSLATNDSTGAVDARVIGRDTLNFQHGERKDTRSRVNIRSVRIEGTLEVTNAEKLRAALTNGIGRGRAYGCGLLTLARMGE